MCPRRVRAGRFARLTVAALLTAGAAACQGPTSKAIDRGSPPPDSARPPLGAQGLEVRSVTFPAHASDYVPLRIVVASTRGEPVALEIDVSADAGKSFRKARLRGAIADLPARPEGTLHVVEWSSLEDVGFHVPRAARLRVVARDSRGASAPLEVDTPSIDNLRAASGRVDAYLIHYGPFDPAAVALAKQHDLVIVHPTAGNLQRTLIAELQVGVDAEDPADDVIVMCYLSIGEDERAFGKTDQEARADPRFQGDGSGPRIDPRGKNPPAGMPLAGIDPAGLPSSGGLGWASYYLDDNSVFRSPTGVGDGIPDRNAAFGGFFVNAGDPRWHQVLEDNLLDGEARVAGAREILGTSHGRGLGCDGLFLDTLDTASPNFNTDAGSPNLAKFEWTAAGMSRLVERLRQSHPDKLLLQNRGLFFLDPRLPHFQLTTRGKIDFLFFESYRLGSSPTPEAFYRNNRHNVVPKLMAEANRNDGFTVLSLGYAEGTGLPEALDTLAGRSMVGLASLIEDIHVAQNLAGFRHYLTNARITLPNTFVRDHSNFDDHLPPAWTSTYNDQVPDPALGPLPPIARVGIQEVVPAAGGLTVRWDVALDLHRVGYALYYQTTPFDFDADPRLLRATRRVLSPRLPAEYAQGVGPRVFPYEDTIRPLDATATYYLVIRAFDASAARNEDRNTVVASGTPAPP
jgi:hypothetical protein